MKSAIQSPTSGAAMTMDAIVGQHYFDALKSLQDTWLNSEKDVDAVHFGMQIEYLICLIPDEKEQERIQKERVRLQEEYKSKKFDHPMERAGLRVVTHLVRFVYASFDLMHFDIVGPATSRQYRDAVAEVPDMPEILIPALETDDTIITEQ
jgi:hypothetical protein